MKRRANLLLCAVVVACSIACSVDETGYFAPDEVDHTSGEPLDANSDRDVMLVGGPGAVGESGGMLTVTNQRSGANSQRTVDDPSGSFVITVAARTGDTLQLRYQLGDSSDEMTLVLDDDLSTVPVPDCLVCSGSIVGPPDENGDALVEVSVLSEEGAALVVFNTQSGATVDAVAGGPNVLIGASSGDTVCVYAVDPQASRSSPANCAFVPEP